MASLDPIGDDRRDGMYGFPSLFETGTRQPSRTWVFRHPHGQHPDPFLHTVVQGCPRALRNVL